MWRPRILATDLPLASRAGTGNGNEKCCPKGSRISQGRSAHLGPGSLHPWAYRIHVIHPPRSYAWCVSTWRMYTLSSIEVKGRNQAVLVPGNVEHDELSDFVG